MKVWSEEIMLNAGSFSPSGVLEYRLSDPFAYQAGDIFGVHQYTSNNSTDIYNIMTIQHQLLTGIQDQLLIPMHGLDSDKQVASM